MGKMKAWHWVSIILVAISLSLSAYSLSMGNLQWWALLISLPINAATISLVALSLSREK